MDMTIGYAEHRASPDPEVAQAEGLRWFVVHTNGNEERLAEEILKRMGYEVYYPQIRRMVTPPRRSVSKAQRKNLHLLAKPKLSPLFPRYPFVRFDLVHDRWHDLFNVIGIRGIVCAGNKPYPLSDSMIEAMRGLEQQGAIPAETPARALLYGLGESVRVSVGPFTGHNGVVEELDEAGRIVLLMHLLGRKVRVEMTMDEVEKL